ncbi:hypothetical protein ACFLUF_01420 [Chloroflexota bacterium]
MVCLFSTDVVLGGIFVFMQAHRQYVSFDFVQVASASELTASEHRVNIAAVIDT